MRLRALKTTRLLLGLSLLAGSVALSAADSDEIVSGTVENVNAAGTELTVKTSDGKQEAVHVAQATTVHGSKSSAASASKGDAVVIHYVAKGSVKTASAVKFVGTGSVKVAQGTVTTVGQGARPSA